MNGDATNMYKFMCTYIFNEVSFYYYFIVSLFPTVNSVISLLIASNGHLYVLMLLTFLC